MVKFYNYDIVFQEVPDEVTLAINLTNCPHRCEGCHSPHLRKDVGTVLDERVLDDLLAKYGRQVTCLCFMGGDSVPTEVAKLSEYVRKRSGLKTAWYSGGEKLPGTARMFDYVKVGPYMPLKGGLDSENTNQRMYKVSGDGFRDITRLFSKTKKRYREDT